MEDSLLISEERINELGSFLEEYIIQSFEDEIIGLDKNQLLILLEENYQDFIEYAKKESILLDSEEEYLEECTDDIDAYIEEAAMELIIDSLIE